MKKINLILVFSCFLLSALCSAVIAQTKADVLACMKKVLDVNDSSAFFQFDTPKPNTAIFLKERDLDRLGVNDEDFLDYDKNVRIWAKEDLFMRGIRANKHLCLIHFSGSELEMSILITTFLKEENDAFFQAAFVLNKEGEDWKIKNQNFNRN